MYNVLYNLIFKVLANQLKVVLPSIINITYSAYVPRHLITNNVMVAFEVLHAIKYMSIGKK